MTILELPVELHENERCWVGRGFSQAGLLPSDRGKFSTSDGSISWKSMEEASASIELLGGRGWSYKEDTGTFEQKRVSEVGVDGISNSSHWMYARDFSAGAMKSAQVSRGVMDWVRYRSLYRVKCFEPEKFAGIPKEIYKQCRYCDSKSVDALSLLLLELLAYTTILHNPSKLTSSTALSLKKDIFDLLAQEATKKQSNNNSTNQDAFYQLNLLYKSLDGIAEKERTRPIHTQLLKEPHRLLSGNEYGTFKDRYQLPDAQAKNFQKRCDEISKQYFTKVEREMMAKLMIRKLDPHHQLHCSNVNCGKEEGQGEETKEEQNDECNFKVVECPNEGCNVRMSKIYLSEHNETMCPYKVITCECGDSFPKHLLGHHQSNVCKLREVSCPFANIGCIKIMKAQDIQNHLKENSESHLLLAVNRMMEYEQVMTKMQEKINYLEKSNNNLHTRMEPMEQSNKTLKDGMKSVQNNVEYTRKQVNNVEAMCKKEFHRLEQEKRKNVNNARR